MIVFCSSNELAKSSDRILDSQTLMSSLIVSAPLYTESRFVSMLQIGSSVCMKVSSIITSRRRLYVIAYLFSRVSVNVRRMGDIELVL